MTPRARGAFDVTTTPQAPEEGTQDTRVGRLSLDKQFHGDLEATSIGQMLTVATDVAGSAGYVAMEWVTGTLHSRTGSFALQHSGTLTRGNPRLSISVVPNSGTGQLVGLNGDLAIEITDGTHTYDFAYSVPESEREIDEK